MSDHWLQDPRARSVGSKERLARLNTALLLAFMAIGIVLVYWVGIRRDTILVRDDNPRLVEAELRIQRGRILDTKGLILAETIGPVDNLRRSYPQPNVGPAVGYYSFRYGTAGIEESFDDILRGSSADFWSDFSRYELLHLPQSGQDIRLTLDSRWQRAADALLGDQAGAVVLLTLPDAAVRAMASHPDYDPNELDSNFDALVADSDAPLLNRATQGLYQPGLVLQPFILAAALDQGLIRLAQPTAVDDVPVMVNGFALTCAASPPEPMSWADALFYGCPGAMLGLVGPENSDWLQDSLDTFGFLSAPVIDLAADASDTPEFNDSQLAIIGQEQLTVSPLQLSVALAALANDGQAVKPQLVQAVQDMDGEWQAQLTAGQGPRLVSPANAAAILAAMPQFEGIAEHAVLALSGPEGSTNAWYLGAAPAADPRYVVVVIVENSADRFTAQRIGRSLLQNIFE